ncbi:protein rep [Helicobacter felistomachi]|uniref:protein rep n=1 Tax=Helicobacter felistomachi TaxID=3040201 RepID=UPI00336A1C1D
MGSVIYTKNHSVLVMPLSYFSNNYITQAQWVEMWAKALRSDYKPIVHIRGSDLSPAQSYSLRALKCTRRLYFNPNLAPPCSQP